MALQLLPSTRAKLDRPGAQPFPLTIQELTGPKRGVVLRGRSLPDQTLRVGVEQRLEIKRYPGNPVGTIQVMGPTFLPTTLTGRWEDYWLDSDEDHAKLINFPAVAPAGRPGATSTGGATFQSSAAVPAAEARLARTLRDAMFLLVKSGQLVKVEWASITRYGVVKRFEPGIEREQDLEYEIEFEWIGDSPSQAKPKLLARVDRLGVLGRVNAALDSALDAINTALALAYGGQAQVLTPFARLTNNIRELAETATSIAQLGFLPADTLAQAKQQLTAVKLAANDVKFAMRERPAAYQAAQDGRGPAGVAEATAASLAAVRALLEMAEAADRGLAEVAELERPDVIGFYTASGGETLRDVALRFYADPAAWLLLRDFNGLTSSILAAGVTVLIPRRDA